MNIRLKAYRIETTILVAGSWHIYSGENAAKAKYWCIRQMRQAGYKADFSWIVSCKRASQYDELCVKYPTQVVAWKDGPHRFQIEEGEWYQGDGFPDHQGDLIHP
jgi:hypothetical protein